MRWLFFGVPALLALLGCKSEERTCLYTIADPYFSGGPGSERLTAKVVLPDGTEHSTRAIEALDGGSRGKTVTVGGGIRGRVTEARADELVVDACEQGAGCEPSQYRLSVSAPGLALAIPVGRTVWATWSFLVGGWETSEQIAILDGNGGDPTDGNHAL
jgi:hypothetical protein